MEKKLQTRHKSSFAFNFTIDSDTDNLQGREQGPFRFDFNPPGTTSAGQGAIGSKEKSSSGVENPRTAQDLVVEIQQRTAEPNCTKKKSKKKGAGKKKKGGKRKGKPGDKEGIKNGTGEKQRQQVLPTKPPSPSRIGDGGSQTDNRCLPLVESESNPKCDDAGHGPAAQDDVGEKSTTETLRPPPGFTLESWKDPALSGEERRRRRFGSGVRNMVAIQRSCDARRGMAVGGDSGTEDILGRRRDLARPDCDEARGNRLAQAGVPGDTVGGPSVFSFGFDIGISFNGGS